jgi:Lon protease-like protein
VTELPSGEFLLPLFPLPNLVFFPQTRLPLHIFEPRYRQMVADAVATDQRFGIVLLRPGWEVDYFGAPPIYTCGTLSQIEQAVPLDDGRFNILVRGEVRFRVVGEVSRDPYRMARVIVQREQERDITAAYAQRTWLAELSQQYLEHLPDQVSVPEIETVGLEALTNALIMSLNLDVQEKQKLLEIDDLISRADEVGRELQNRIEGLRFLKPYRRKGGDPSHN